VTVREHCVKLAHGFRIECVTTSDREARTVNLEALTYEGSTVLREHVGMATGDSLNTCGSVVDWRNEFLAGVQADLEASVEYLIALRDARWGLPTYDQFVRSVTLDGQREFGQREDLQAAYDNGFNSYSRGAMTIGNHSHAFVLGWNDAHEQDGW